ncbi:MAG: diaminobutyrate acetyltransferase [Thiohalomonadaceae bacterium]
MSLIYRKPQLDDGQRIHKMVLAAGTLDINSAYLYYLLADHFRDTVVLAESADGTLLGFVTAYRPPNDPHHLFIWQIAVAPAARGQGIGSGLLKALLQRPFMTDIQRIDCTITSNNTASLSLFRHLAALLKRPYSPAIPLSRTA